MLRNNGFGLHNDEVVLKIRLPEINISVIFVLFQCAAESNEHVFSNHTVLRLLECITVYSLVYS